MSEPEERAAQNWKERASADGWKVDRPCQCAAPHQRPATVGGHGYVMRICLTCRRPVYIRGVQ